MAPAMRSLAAAALACCCLAALASGQGVPNQLTTPMLTEQQQRALFEIDASNGDPFLLDIRNLGSVIENAAVRLLPGDKASFPFLATLPRQGSATYITALKPCGQIAPHLHPRATEQYVVLSGVMETGLSEEVGGLPNVTAKVYPGQSFVAPQGLLHYNAASGCSPTVFVQTFDSADPGLLSVVLSLSTMRAASPEIVAAAAGDITAGPLAPFALDAACLARCGLSSSGGDLSNLSGEMQAIMGLTGSPAPSSG